MKLAILTSTGVDPSLVHDSLLEPALIAAGWQVETLPWRHTDFSQFDAVVVRSTWDYQEHLDEFYAALKRIHEQCARMANPISLMRWNMNKEYLKDLEKNGVPIVPTEWSHQFSLAQVQAQFERFGVDEIIVKPTVSAGSADTFRLSKTDLETSKERLERLFSNRGHMIQPFLADILTQGEVSLFFFGGELSHTIRKRPANGDFRVQEEFGAELVIVDPTAEQVAVAKAALAALPESPLYARIDMVHAVGWVIMELELIEPSLYFNLDAESPGRFVRAFLDWFHAEQQTHHSS